MARIVELLEIDLNGSVFRLELGGLVALMENETPVAVVRVDNVQEATQLETLASGLGLSFRWNEGHDREQAISVADFRARVSAEPKRFQPTTEVVPSIELELPTGMYHQPVRLAPGGVVGLFQRDAPVARVRINAAEEAERIQRMACRFYSDLKWKLAENGPAALSVEEFERMVSADRERFVAKICDDHAIPMNRGQRYCDVCFVD